MSFRYRHAIVRGPAASYHLGLTSETVSAGDIERFDRQHSAYVEALAGAGLDVETLEPLDAFPDAHFVEDVAVFAAGSIVLTRPGAPSRRGEVEHIEAVLRRHGELQRIAAPGTLEGGDVLVIGRRCFIGLSRRTNADGARQLMQVLEARGLKCTTVPVDAGLHLKSSVSAIAEDTIVLTGAFAGHEAFTGFRRIEVDAGEAYAANLLRVNDRLLVPEGYPRTLERIAALDLDLELVRLDVSEARRMDGGLTCMSLRF